MTVDATICEVNEDMTAYVQGDVEALMFSLLKTRNQHELYSSVNSPALLSSWTSSIAGFCLSFSSLELRVYVQSYCKDGKAH